MPASPQLFHQNCSFTAKEKQPLLCPPPSPPTRPWGCPRHSCYIQSTMGLADRSQLHLTPTTQQHHPEIGLLSSWPEPGSPKGTILPLPQASPSPWGSLETHLL